MSDDVQIGRVIKPHGVRGEFVVDPTTDDPAGRFTVGTVLHGRQGGRERELTIASVRPHQGRLLIKVEEAKDRNEVESLRGMKFVAPAVTDDDDEAFYDHELIGLHVLDCGAVDADTASARAYDGQDPEPVDIGTISAVQRGPAHRLLVVAAHEGKKEYLIPFVHAIVPIVDLDNEAIVITPPEGLLDL